MFPLNMKLYIYPTKRQDDNEMVTSANVKMDDDIRLLYGYLLKNRFILDLKSDMSEQLHVTSQQVLKMIQKGDPGWEKYVPMTVARTIKEKHLFLK